MFQIIPKNIIEYVKVYDNFIDADCCDQTVASLEKIDWAVHKFYNPGTNSYFSHEKELATSFDDIIESALLKEKIWSAIAQYVVKDFSNFKEWFPGWEGFAHLKFNKYVAGTEMAVHCDHIKTVFDGNRRGVPILSVILLLNDSYTGGDFIMWEDTKINLKKGSICIFPSNFIFPHRVQEITSGIRYTCVSWVW
jgi:hypothetical protein